LDVHVFGAQLDHRLGFEKRLKRRRLQDVNRRRRRAKFGEPGSRDVAKHAWQVPRRHPCVQIDRSGNDIIISGRAAARPAVDAANATVANRTPASRREIGAFTWPPRNQRPRELLGGVSGRIVGQTCEVQLLWLSPEIRGERVGSELMRMYEAEAVARGCTLSALSTLSFQARGFYEKLGYQTRMEIPGYGNGAVKHIMLKPLFKDDCPREPH
jgi:GNAT superfamily N-acetyltransferase